MCVCVCIFCIHILHAIYSNINHIHVPVLKQHAYNRTFDHDDVVYLSFFFDIDVPNCPTVNLHLLRGYLSNWQERFARLTTWLSDTEKEWSEGWKGMKGLECLESTCFVAFTVG